MRILHIQLTGPYTEDFNYQENIIPKYHVKQGHEVFFLTTCYAWDKGEMKYVPPEKKVLVDGVHLERVKFVNFGVPILTRRLRLVPRIFEKLVEISPDFIMLHDIQSLSDIGIVKYLKQYPNVKMIVDCHADFSNSARSFLSKNFLHGILWRKMAHVLEPYTKKFFGVLPARCDFLIEMYRLPKNKVELLVMGADDELVVNALEKRSDNHIRKKNGILTNDFLIITGGKIDFFKTQTLQLMEAIKSIQRENVKLIVFGSVDPRLQDRFERFVDDNHVKYVGWLSAHETYEYLVAADLVCFPGRHSVLWEQAAGMGIPLLVKYWEGTTHVDCGGNADFLYEDSVDEIIAKVSKIVVDKSYYNSMKIVAEERAIKYFSYADIARRCLE